ncbi:DUF6161 domain-containing protein [Francisella hispaniensis]|uniref:DUF6161 domain-containing protein n=1 Tax=Francisella hispaniensis TaxID=622488 RepID=F4BK91_9GAMM|nr:DUF6161 domain-containing protein [Francisella hispaniensis]AEB28585.1 hypothetical protein FN3523_0728 [Francisella hispaniensis]
MKYTISDYLGKNWQFDDLNDLRIFLEDELVVYEEKATGILNSPISKLKQAINQIDNHKNQIANSAGNALSQQISNFQRSFLNLSNANWIWSGQPSFQKYLEARKISPGAGQAFLHVLKNSTNASINNYDSLRGYILGYEYEMQGKSEITQRQKSEESSYERLRERLDTKTNEIVSFAGDKKSEVEEIVNKFNDDVKQAQDDRDREFKELNDKIEKNFDTLIEKKTKELENLEHTYHEKLRLEKPAEYWGKRAKNYRNVAFVWGTLLAFLLIVGVYIGLYFFNHWLAAKEIGLKLDTFQGAIIFASIIGLYGYLIRLFSKMTLSSFHLQNDAKEREQLTYVYLALTNDSNAVTEESRNIVLQALFSRADYGLLGRDSSPVMPSSINELINLIKNRL